jgi:hypothetical protein
MKKFIRVIYKNRYEILKSVVFMSVLIGLAYLGFWWVVSAVGLWVFIDLAKGVK